MPEQELEASDQIEQTEESPVPEPAKSGKRIAHYHLPDRRARQTGPIVPPGVEIRGRQSKEPCYETRYNVRNPGGFKIQEILYRGEVVVPQCVADYLTYMDQLWETQEHNLFRNNRVDRLVGNL